MGRLTGAWNRLSLAAKLPLSLGVLLTVILVGMTLVAYTQVRRSAYTGVSDRLRSVSQQLAEMIESGWRTRLNAAEAVADWQPIVSYLRTPVSSTSLRALDTLNAYARRAGQQTAAVEVWSADGQRLLFAKSERPEWPQEGARQLSRSVTTTNRTTVGRMTAFGDTVEYPFIAAVVEGGRVLGYVVERRLVTGSSASIRTIADLVGEEAQLLLGNRAGDLWTDFTQRVPGPARLTLDSGTTRYTRAGADVFANIRPLAIGPLSVIVEFPAAPVVAAPTRFLVSSIVLSLLFAAGGAAAGALLSRRITIPLRRVTESAESIAAGKPSARVESDRRDEVGRLAASFNSMAQQVEEGRNRLEAALQRYRLLFDENPHPMFLMDPVTLAVLDVNAAALRKYGYTRTEFLALSLRDIRPPGDGDVLKLEVARLRPGLSDAGMRQHRLKNGALIDVEITRQVMDLDGRRVVLVLAHDITSRVAAERARRESAEELQRLNAELEQRVHDRTAELRASNQELEAFSYSVSHDLRAPLRAIDGFAKILQEDHAAEMSEQARRSLEVIARNARQMGQLIDDLLSFSRLGRQPLSVTAIDMTELARQVIEETQRTEGARPVELSMDDLPPTRGERALLRQVLANYIQNAFKFTRARNPARIELGARADDGEVVYFVRDNGTGFDMRYADKLFGVFQRLHRAEEYEGTGVGLAIVKRIVLRHGGRVWAEGEEGRGATFYFTLPQGTPPT